MNTEQITALLKNIMLDEQISEKYKEAVGTFLELNVSCQSILMSAYELAAELTETEPDKRMPESVSRFVIEKYTDELEHGNGTAGCVLGVMYIQGRFGDTEFLKAYECFARAAALKNTRGIALLGTCYYCGMGVGKDFKKAAELFESVKEDTLSLLLQGMMLADGTAGRTDRTEAYFRFLQCADQIELADTELFGAELNTCLGDCFYEGYAGGKDICEALRYYYEAEVQYYKRILNGDFYAGRGLQRVKEKSRRIQNQINRMVADFTISDKC